MGGAIPLLVSFGTGLVSRYNQRKKAESKSEYDQILLDAKNDQESKLLTEERDYQFNLANTANQQDINDTLAERNFEMGKLAKQNEYAIGLQESKVTQANLDRLQKLADDKTLLKYEDTLASTANAISELNGYEVFGTGNNSFKLNQYPSADGNPEVGPEWDAKKMEDLNSLISIPGFKDRVLAMDDTSLASFQTYATNLFSKYRVSNAKRNETNGEYLAFARIKPNKNGKGSFQNLFNTDKYPEILGINEAHQNSTNYIKSLAYEDVKKNYSNISDVLMKSDEEGTYDYVLPLDDIKTLYPNMPLEDVFAAAQIVATYNPELATGDNAMNRNMEVIYNLKNRPTDLFAAKRANTYDRTGATSDGVALLNFWNDHPEAYGTKDGYVMQEDGSMFFEGVDHEARLDSLALGVLPSLISDNDPNYIAVLDSETGAEAAQKRLISSQSTTIGEIKSTATQGINVINIMNNILTTYDPRRGGSPLTGGMLDLAVFIEGFQSQISLIGESLSPTDANSFLQSVYVDNKLTAKTREAISTFKYKGETKNVIDSMFQEDDFALQVEAQRKFFATSLNYSVSMILQGGTGGKTISDTDYQIMEKSMYNGLFTSKGLNKSALEAIFKTVRLPSIIAQYKTDLDNTNAIQNMQAAVKYERLINYDGIQTYKQLTKQLNGYSGTDAEVGSKKDDYFQGNAYLGKSKMGYPRMEKVDNKSVVYVSYTNGTKMPMRYEDVENYYRNFASGISKDSYLEFENEIFDTYREYFSETLNADAGNERIVKDVWKETQGINPDKLP